MRALDDVKRRLRDRSEHYLMQAAVRDLGAGAPGTVAPYRERGGRLWRLVFVPLYRRVPWTAQAARDGRPAHDRDRVEAARARGARAVAPAPATTIMIAEKAADMIRDDAAVASGVAVGPA